MQGEEFMKKWKHLLVVGVVLLLAFSGCSTREPEPEYSPEEQQIVDEILKERKQKDLEFLTEDWSPLLPEDKEHFKGLKYYPVDLSYRFEGPIVKYDSTILDTIIGTKGDLRPAIKYGYFEFQYNGNTYRLQIYKFMRDKPELQKYLFLGFTDATSGKETYGAGRYIDLIENEQNFYIVDFNLAYNPYCAYNPRYTCAIPPPENRLPFPVYAGEKIFKSH